MAVNFPANQIDLSVGFFGRTKPLSAQSYQGNEQLALVILITTFYFRRVNKAADALLIARGVSVFRKFMNEQCLPFVKLWFF